MATYSTYATASAAYFDNSDWDDGAGSVTKARNFKNACRALLVLKPTSAADGEGSHSFDMGLIAKRLESVKDWLDANDDDVAVGGCVQTLDFSHGRS